MGVLSCRVPPLLHRCSAGCITERNGNGVPVTPGRSRMTYAIVYDSRTGNTKRRAQAVAETLPADGRLAFGNVGEVDGATLAAVDRAYVLSLIHI